MLISNNHRLARRSREARLKVGMPIVTRGNGSPAGARSRVSGEASPAIEVTEAQRPAGCGRSLDMAGL